MSWTFTGLWSPSLPAPFTEGLALCPQYWGLSWGCHQGLVFSRPGQGWPYSRGFTSWAETSRGHSSPLAIHHGGNLAESRRALCSGLSELLQHLPSTALPLALRFCELLTPSNGPISPTSGFRVHSHGPLMSQIAPLRLVGDKGFPKIFLRATPCTLIEHQLCASPCARHGSREASVSSWPVVRGRRRHRGRDQCFAQLGLQSSNC